jgi:hypothetical protein
MASLGLQGVIRGKPARTTISDEARLARRIMSTGSSMRRGRMRFGSRLHLRRNLGWFRLCCLRVRDPGMGGWFNKRRLLEPIGNIPPAEAEERYYAMLEQPAMAA